MLDIRDPDRSSLRRSSDSRALDRFGVVTGATARLALDDSAWLRAVGPSSLRLLGRGFVASKRGRRRCCAAPCDRRS
jgi:hypothetical protein